eukprot:4529167-Lingulodinium_polyedra.AAC.1
MDGGGGGAYAAWEPAAWWQPRRRRSRPVCSQLRAGQPAAPAGVAVPLARGAQLPAPPGVPQVWQALRHPARH